MEHVKLQDNFIKHKPKSALRSIVETPKTDENSIENNFKQTHNKEEHHLENLGDLQYSRILKSV